MMILHVRTSAFYHMWSNAVDEEAEAQIKCRHHLGDVGTVHNRTLIV